MKTVKARKTLTEAASSHGGMTGDLNVKDIHGNNAAVLCPACQVPFVFSGFLDGKRGRACPHCKNALAALSDGKLRVELTTTAG